MNDTQSNTSVNESVHNETVNNEAEVEGASENLADQSNESITLTEELLERVCEAVRLAGRSC